MINSLAGIDNNLLPYDGIAIYHRSIFSNKESDRILQELSGSIHWEHDEINMFGKRIITKRKVAWYGDQPFEYNYSNHARQALPWNALLLEIKQLIEKATNEQYNSCLLNLYQNGEEGMGWHADNEKELKENGAIASLSLGAERKFQFKHRTTKERIELQLENGALLVMKGDIQKRWLHQLPKSKKISAPRINLTFRTILP